jgi:hypothetical protein
MRPFFVLLVVAGLAEAQAPKIGVLDFYGLRKIPEQRVRQALGAREGDPLPPSKGDVEERLDKITGVVESHLEAVCCDGGKVVLYVGVEERGSLHFEIREPPEGDERLPSEITGAYARFLEAVEKAGRRGNTGEDLTQGYSRIADLSARAIQDMFPVMAKDHMAELRAVLRNSDDEQQRASAAYVIGYAADRKTVVNELQFALRDADPGVRANATRGLVALSVRATLDPNSGIKVEPTWFIEMLNSLSWSDRNRAAAALQVLTDKRDPAVLDQLRERALPALADMARWKTLSHALPAYILLGRAAGIPEERIQASWSSGDREPLIAEALKSQSKLSIR